MEKVPKQKHASKTYAAELSGGEAETVGEEDDIQNDLEKVYDEYEIIEAFSSYQQVNKALKEQKVARGCYDPKGSGSSRASHSGRGSHAATGDWKRFEGRTFIKKDSGERGSRIHVYVLKLRKRCSRCGVTGHGARECTNAPKKRLRSVWQNKLLRVWRSGGS